jgi:hypothetical protein
MGHSPSVHRKTGGLLLKTAFHTLWKAAFAITLAATLSATLSAQNNPSSTGYFSVTCLKLEPGKSAEFRSWMSDVVRKIAQSRVDAGILTSWELYREVLPQGSESHCDYAILARYPGLPPEPTTDEALPATLKKAGINLTAQQYIERRNSVAHLVGNSIGQTRASVGSYKLGDYLVINHMKVTNLDDWIAYEKKAWQPVAEAMDKDGVRSGWSVSADVMPFGSDVGSMGTTADVYPSWDAIFKEDPAFLDRWRKAHPDMEIGTTMEQYDKLRTITFGHVVHLEDAVGSLK